MLSGAVVLAVTAMMAFGLIRVLESIFPELINFRLRTLYFYHAFLAFVYYLYALSSPSDSASYYNQVLTSARGSNWGDYFGVSTTFVEFVVYPFIKYLGFSYEASMILFSFFGFVGFVYFLIFFKENLKFKHKVFGYDFLTIVFFLPNLHFWSSSLGKGSLIFMGFGLLFFGINQPLRRFWAIALGGLIIYYVRPHIMLIILVSAILSFGLSGRGLNLSYRIFIFLVSGIAFAYIYQDVLAMVGIEQTELLTQGLDLTHRAKELSKATSGVDISSYSLPAQLLTFWFRPLFFDAPGILGLIVSFENAFYIIMFVRLLTFSGIKFLVQSDYLVKTAFFSFVTVSIALAQVSGNLGIAMRQKSQVMILMLFVILKYMDQQKSERYNVWKRRRIKIRKEQVALDQLSPQPS